MKSATMTRVQQPTLRTNLSPRDRQESIRRSWSTSEKMRRRHLAIIQQLRLLGVLQAQLERTAC